MMLCVPRQLPDRVITSGRWGGLIGRCSKHRKECLCHAMPFLSAHCHPEPGGAPEGQSTAKDPQLLTREEGCRLGVLRPSSAPSWHRRLKMTALPVCACMDARHSDQRQPHHHTRLTK